VESQAENAAVALVNGALAQGLHFVDLEPALAAAALAHYNDFGHSLIYLMHVRRLIERLGTEVEKPLLLAWLRSLIFATREDLLPDFRRYADALAAWPAGARSGAALPGPDSFEGQRVRQVLEATVAAAGHAPLDIYFALMEACARHLLRFDERHAAADRQQRRRQRRVAGLQPCTHFRPCRASAMRAPAPFVAAGSAATGVVRGAQQPVSGSEPGGADGDPRVGPSATKRRSISAPSPPWSTTGPGLPIFSVHWLKTWSAVRDETAAGLPTSVRTAMLAAVNRLLAVRFKQRHTLRTAHQALGFVTKED